METMMKNLKFNRVELPTGEAWVTGFGVGEYKVVQYGKFWYSYVHKSWQSNWGNSCEHDTHNKSQEYSTRLQAQKAAQKHYQTVNA